MTPPKRPNQQTVMQIHNVGDVQIDDAGIQPLFSDVAALHVSAEECRITFAVRNPDKPSHGKGVGKIYITLPHAKRFLNALAAAIKQYEEAFGPIPVDMRDRMNPELRQFVEDNLKKQGKENRG